MPDLDAIRKWRTELLEREKILGHRLVTERRLFNATLQGGGHQKARPSIVVVRWNQNGYLKSSQAPQYPATELNELGWKLQPGDKKATRHVLQGPAATQRRLLKLLRAVWKGQLEARGELTIAVLDDKRRRKCRACLKTYGSASKKPPSSRSGGKLWCNGKSRWNKHPAARTLSKTCRQCVKDFCVCKNVGARSGRTYGCSRCSACI